MPVIDNTVNEIYFGAAKVDEVYFGATKVWPLVTQAMLDAYTRAVLEKRSIDSFASKGWIEAAASFNAGALYLGDHGSWGYPWSSFLDDHARHQLYNAIRDFANAGPGSKFYINLENSAVTVSIVVSYIMKWTVDNDNRLDHGWYYASADAYLNAGSSGRPQPPGDYGDKILQWLSLSARVTDLSAIGNADWQGHMAEILQAARIMHALTHKAEVDAKVAAAAKAITDLGGTLPNVP